MRKLLHRRHTGRGRIVAAAVCVAAAYAAGSPARAASESDQVTVHITSPLGRSGLPGKVRIVARVTAPFHDAPPQVRFYVDDVLLGTDTDGPPYAIEWDDENPFEKRRLAVEVDDASEGVARDEIELQPFELVDVAQVMSVGVDAAVQDARGHFVGGLTAADFQLLEDGKPQEIDQVTSDAVPATFAMLIDASQSMSTNIDFVRAAAARLPDYLRDVDSVVIAPFRQGIVRLTGPTRDPATIAEAVTAVNSAGPTAILDALAQVTGRFADGIGRRVVVLVTDGYDEQSQGSAEETLQDLKASHVTVYVISVGGIAGVSIKGERLLRRIAAETGGRAFFPWNHQQLAEAHAAIADDVQHQYRMTYTPVNQRQDGAWRTITVTTTHPEQKVRAREGYRAPSPPPVRASLEFTVTDAHRQLVELTSDDIEVYEDGVQQSVDVFNEAVAPVSIELALDASGSMARSAPAVQEAANVFVDALRPDDPLGLILFANESESIQDLGTRREGTHEGIQTYKAHGGTALYDALADAIVRMRTVEGRRVVVVMTDGRDENADSTGPGSVRTWDDVLTAARDVNATIYAIGLGTNVEREGLEKLTALTGGEAFFTNDVTELEQQYRRIVEELHRRYVIAYTSTNAERDGSWRKVEIRLREDGLNARSRGGYFAPQD